MEDHIEKEMIALLPRLTRFARALTRSQQDAEDLVQATCERAIANLDKWEPGTRLDSWMYRIAHNLRRNEVRDTATRSRKLDLVGASETVVVDGERVAFFRLQAQSVEQALSDLPDDQRAALLLVAAEGRSYAEVAEITGATVAAVTSRVARARDSLRQKMGQDA